MNPTSTLHLTTRRGLLAGGAGALAAAPRKPNAKQTLPASWTWDRSITDFASLKRNVWRFVERKGYSIPTLTMLGDLEACRKRPIPESLLKQSANGWLPTIESLVLKGEGYLPQQEILIRQRERMSDCIHLKHVPRYPMRFLYPLINSAADLTRWIETQNWRFPWGVGNIDMDTAYAIAFEWKVMGNAKARDALRVWFDWHDRHIDPATGFWDLAKTGELRNAMAGAMHQYGIYFLFGRDVPHAGKAVEATLSLQEPTGLFSPDTFSHNCLDIDAVFVLANLYHKHHVKVRETRAALERAFEANLKCFHPGGGAMHRTGIDQQPDWWSTWCRVAITGWCARILDLKEFRGPWDFHPRHPFQSENGGKDLPGWEDDRWYDATDWPRPRKDS